MDRQEIKKIKISLEEPLIKEVFFSELRKRQNSFFVACTYYSICTNNNAIL